MKMRLPRHLLNMLLDIAEELYSPNALNKAKKTKSFGEIVTTCTRGKIYTNVHELVRLYKCKQINEFEIVRCRLSRLIRIHKAQLRKLPQEVDPSNFIFFYNLKKLIDFVVTTCGSAQRAAASFRRLSPCRSRSYLG